MTLEQKIDARDKLECGESVASVARHFRISEASVKATEQSWQLCGSLMKQVH
jgi:hypothetical protein